MISTREAGLTNRDFHLVTSACASWWHDAVLCCAMQDLIAAGIIDPAKVTRSGLTNACGIAGIMLTTQACASCMLTCSCEHVSVALKHCILFNELLGSSYWIGWHQASSCISVDTFWHRF